jgi:transcriptional regulator with XRE-family HTH domain
MTQGTTGQRIKQALKAAGITQRQLAVYCRVSEQSVGNWVSDRIEPKASHFEAMTDVLGVTASWLLTGEQTVDAQEMLREMRQLRAAQEEILLAILEMRRQIAKLTSE